MSECLFCRIVQRQVPAQIVAEDDECLALRDINPQAPTHLLVIPKLHIPKVSDLTIDTAKLLGKAALMANRLAAQLGLDQGYRLVVNCGPQAGQTVWHVHLHLLGGRAMGWPPG